MSKLPVSLLIIYILFSSEVLSQNLNLNIYGENEKETAVIDSMNYTKKHSDFASVNAEIDSVQKTLFKLGYIESKIKSVSKNNDSIYTAFIQLQKKYNTIYIYYDKIKVSENILNKVSKNVTDTYFVLSIEETESALNYINSKIAEQGFPFTTLKLSDITVKDESNLQSQLIIGSNPDKRTIDKIIVKGYDKFSKSYLKHYLKVKPSGTFSIDAVKNKTKRLNNLKFASEIKSPEVLFTKDSTILYLYIKKSKSNSFDGFLGFGTNEDTNKLEFDGYLNLSLNNNLNYGESFDLIYKSDENDQKTFKVNLSLPYLLGTPLGSELGLNIFKQDSSYTIVNQTAKLFYQLNSKSKIYAGITATQSNNLRSENTTLLIDDYDTTLYSLAYNFTNLQVESILFPINISLYAEVGFGERKSKNSNEKQNSLLLDAFKIFNLNKKNSLYFRLTCSGLFSDTYFENELLRFGGINSVRGFEENSFMASLFGVINTEYRYQLNNNIYVHSIIDLAYFENKITVQKEKLYGFGFGFGLLTKAGLFKMNYANGKSENQQFKFANSKIHLSLIADF